MFAAIQPVGPGQSRPRNQLASGTLFALAPGGMNKPSLVLLALLLLPPAAMAQEPVTSFEDLRRLGIQVEGLARLR